MLSRQMRIVLALAGLGIGCGSGNGSTGGTDGGGGGNTDGTVADGGVLPDGSHPGSEGGGGGGDTGTTSESGTGSETSTEGGGGGEGGGDSGTATGASVLQYHLNATRDGHYIDPLMTKTYAANMKFDTTFIGSSKGPGVPIHGPLWAQPLYVENGVGGKGTFYTADDSNYIYAIDETTGNVVWSKTPLAEAAGQAGSGCGNITPVGITGTPIIDLSSRTMYFSAAQGIASGIQSHQIYAVSIDDGSIVKGWPVDVDNLTSAAPSKVKFNPQPQEQRSALSIFNGNLWVPYGGEDGDCGDYHGWIVTVPLTDPSTATAYATPATQAGFWAVGGMASDGVDIFATTCNGQSGGLSWPDAQTEAVLRFHDGTFDPSKTTDYFTPSNWKSSMDPGDLDLGGSGPLVVDVPGATPSALIVQLSKTGDVHLLDRSNLGGIGTGNGSTGEGLYSEQVAPGGAGSGIKMGAAVYTTTNGTYVAFHAINNGLTCPSGQSGDLIAIKITGSGAKGAPQFTTAWCNSTNGNSSPIVTTTDSAGSNAIVWVVGAEGTNELYAWDGETGAAVFKGTGTGMDTIQHFNTPIEVKGRIIVGANDKLYAFTGK